MKTRILALLLVLVMVLGMLASCGGGDNNADNNNDDDDNVADNGNNNGGGNTDDENKPDDGNNGGQTGGDQTGDENKPNDDPGKDDPGKDDPGKDDPVKVDKEYEILWDDTTLIFQMTENSNQQELPSTCKRYLAGESTDLNDFDQIDTMVSQRNAAAYATTGVNVSYTYLPDTTQYGWGQNIETIFTEVNSGSSTRPDIYCNFVYDMVSTSLKGSFANLYSTSRGEGVLKGANYFEFANPGFADTGVGYMYEYMRSLTLSKHKMYCLSSDYFTDMVRAFFVVPVNIQLIETLQVDLTTEDSYNSDRDGDEEFTVADFYELVWAGQWNYEMLAAYSKAIYQPGEAVQGGNANGTLNDTLGFAISASSGLSASGMLYTTSVEIIARPFNEDTNDYEYYYPDTNNDLFTFCNNITDLFKNTRGIVAITEQETYNHGDTSLQAIRNRFATGNVLFGGVICLGSLEYNQYKDMESGFGVAPCPLYRNVDPVTQEPDKYLTQIHNIGRVGAISDTTTKFAQCSAFLDYMSLNSTDILNEYYDFKLQFDIAGGSADNVAMLQYIRENVRSSFDKAFEDAIGRFFMTTDEDSDNNKWHKIIMDGKFVVDGSTMQTHYDSLIDTKKSKLLGLQDEYTGLPD